MRVLLVDYDPTSKDPIENLTRDTGDTLFCAVHGQAGLDLLREQGADLILVSALLPDCDMRHFLKQARETAPHALLASLLGRSDDTKALELLRWGADDFLDKPLSPARLSAVFKHARRQYISLRPNTQHTSSVSVWSKPLLTTAKSDFAKAQSLNVPLLIEGGRNTGKWHLAQTLLQTSDVILKPILIDAEETSDLREIRNHPDTRNQLPVSVCIRHVECLNKTAQQMMLEGIKQRQINPVIVTCRGRLMDHVKAGRLMEPLGMALGVMPFLMPDLDARPDDKAILIAQFRDDAAAFFGNHHVIDVQQLQTALAGQTFEDNISGLRRAVFKACLNGLTDHEANVAKQQKHDAASPTIQAAFGFLPWLDKNGQFRTMQAIEEDMVRLAHTHFKGRLGRMAKGLGWGRTTLYRRLQSLEDSLSQAAPTSDTQEGDLIGLEDQTAEHMGDMGSQIQAESDVRAA